jgi:hypothetical protein
MVRISMRLWCCAAMLALGTFVPKLHADDWLSTATDPKPASFRAARYDGEKPASVMATPSNLRVDETAEAVPAPVASVVEPSDGTITGEIVNDFESCFEDGMGEFGLLPLNRAWQLTAGADYLNARPTFSEATAFARIENFTTNSRQELVQYDFAYNASPRIYAGISRPDCKSELRFTFTQLQGNSQIASGAPVGDTVIILDPTLPVCSCTQVEANASVNANMYDIDFGHRNCFQPTCCADPCGQSCARPCQPWDVTYWMGIRIADVKWDSFGSIIDVDSQDLVATNEHQMTFTGAGPRVGINVRRYFGRHSRFSLYGRANLALVLGHYQIKSTYFETDGTDTDTNLLSRDRVIPVTEIELGMSYNIRQRTTISAGYFMQAWHDLGMSQQITGQFPQGYDDANILSFDGLFVRGEWNF